MHSIDSGQQDMDLNSELKHVKQMIFFPAPHAVICQSGSFDCEAKNYTGMNS